MISTKLAQNYHKNYNYMQEYTDKFSVYKSNFHEYD